MVWYIWLIIAGICLVAEIATVGFLVFWFGIGAFLTMVLSFWVQDPIIQISFFLITSTLLIFLTKPFVNKFINGETVVTNASSLIGQKGFVTADITLDKPVGLTKVGSEVWSTVANEEIEIKKGTEVVVTRIDGVKLVVTPCK